MTIAPQSVTHAAASMATSTAHDARPFVLHVRAVRGPGGSTERSILRATAHAEETGVLMAAACIRPVVDPAFDAVRGQADAWRCPLFEVPARGPLDPRAWARLLRLCRRLEVSVWHGHDRASNLLGLLLRHRHRMQLVTTVHEWTAGNGGARARGRLDGWCLRRCNHVIAVNRAVRERCLRLGVAPRRVSVVPDEVDAADFRDNGSIDRARDLVTGHVGFEARMARVLGVYERVLDERAKRDAPRLRRAA